MFEDLDGKVAVVTGGARGLGLEMADALAEQGCAVVLLDLGDGVGASAARLGERRGVPTLGLRADVTDDADAADVTGAADVADVAHAADAADVTDEPDAGDISDEADAAEATDQSATEPPATVREVPVWLELEHPEDDEPDAEADQVTTEIDLRSGERPSAPQ